MSQELTEDQVELKETCSKCLVEKNISVFKKNRKVCLTCSSIYHSNYYQENKDHIIQQNHDYYVNTIDERKKYHKNYYYERKDQIKIKNKLKRLNLS